MNQADFVCTLMDMRGGKVAAHISGKFQELIAAVADVHGAGTLTLKLTVKPKLVDHRGVQEIEVDCSCDTRKPERHPGSSVFYLANDGRLTRDDPSQQELFEEQQPNGPVR